MLLLVDGNNCLHALYPKLPLEVARARLENFLIKLANEKDLEVKVFFDQPFPERRVEIVGGIKLFFPQVGECADNLIEQEILKLSNENYAYLVTSDRSLRDLAQLKKVICLKPSQLLSLKREREKKFFQQRVSYKIATRISEKTLRKLQALKEENKI